MLSNFFVRVTRCLRVLAAHVSNSSKCFVKDTVVSDTGTPTWALLVWLNVSVSSLLFVVASNLDLC